MRRPNDISTPVSDMATTTLRGMDNAQYAIEGLERAWKRSSFSDAYTEVVRKCIDDARFELSFGRYRAAQEAVSRGWKEMECGS